MSYYVRIQFIGEYTMHWDGGEREREGGLGPTASYNLLLVFF